MNIVPFAGGRKDMLVAGGVGLTGLLATLLGVFVQPQKALFSYLVAFSYWTGIAVAALILVAVFHTANAKWMTVLRRTMETMASTVVVFLPLFLPIALGMQQLYLWVSPPATLPEHTLHLLHHKQAYLNVPFFIGRGVFYFVVWTLIAQLLRSWSLKQDGAAGDLALKRRLQRFSAASLPALALTMTFAAVDWMMSLDPIWYSTLFGGYYFAGSFVAAIAVLTLVTVLPKDPTAPGALANAGHLHNLGKLLLAFVCFWAYLAFSQYMLMWAANLPEEVPWYISRTQTRWKPLAYVLLAGHFMVPFLLLLSRDWKRSRRFLIGISGWILLVHFVDLYWMVMPALSPDYPVPTWTDATAFLGVGGVAVAFGIFRQRGVMPAPVGDPTLEYSLRYSQP